MGYDIWNQKEVAIRKVNTAKVAPDSLQFIRHGTSIHALLDHPCIVRCYYCSEDENYITTVEELVQDGSLLDYIQRHRNLKGDLRLDEEEILVIARQLLFALAYLKQKGVAHRDLKLDNVLYDEASKRVKLADFGFAEFVSPSAPLMRTFPGTLAYAPPEVLLGLPYDPYPREMWSLGVMIYGLFTGLLPFGAQESKGTKYRVLTEEPSYSDARFGKCSNEAKVFLQRALQKDPKLRLTLEVGSTSISLSLSYSQSRITCSSLSVWPLCLLF